MSEDHTDIRAEARERLVRGESRRSVARATGLSRWQVTRIALSMGAEDTDTVLAAKDAHIASLRREATRLERQVGNWQQLVEHWARLAPTMPVPKSVHVDKDFPLGEQELVATLTDAHANERWSKAQTDGLTEWSFERFAESLYYYASELQRIEEELRPLYGLKRLHVQMLGDMWAGHLRLDDEVTGEFPTSPGLIAVSSVLFQWLLRLTACFEHVAVTCMAGNHGRIHRKPQSKRYVGENLDTLVYMMVREMARVNGLVASERMSFAIPKSRQYTFQRLGHKIKLAHGDHIRGGNSIAQVPIYGLSRDSLRQAMREARSGRGAYLEQFVIGHFHIDDRHQGLLHLSGSLCPTGPWAMDDRGAFDDPTQLVYLTSKDHVFGWSAPLSIKHGWGKGHRFAYDLGDWHGDDVLA